MTNDALPARRRTGGLVAPALVLAIVLALATGPRTSVARAQADPRFFAETGFSISNDAFWNYFQRRGGLRTFGYPISREFLLEGFRVQFFQRQVMQLRGDGGVQLLNLLDSGVLPYTTINGSTFPAINQDLVNAAPSASDPAYGDKVLAFMRQNAPDTWEGKPVNFGNTALSLVSYDDAFPNGDGPASLVPLISVLEVAGLPTSAPAADPNNGGFIYQRFQRLILQYDAATNTTQALLLADYLKAVITGQNLPSDLQAQAQGSKYYRQYDRHRDRSLARPDALPNTDLTNAFEREDQPLPAVDALPTVSIAVKPEQPSVGGTFSITLTASDDAGVSRVSWRAVNSGAPELDQPHDADCGGTTPCVRSWNVVSRTPGQLALRARAVDTAGQESDPVRLAIQVANTLQGALEQPANGARVGGKVTISGWAVERASPDSSGIQAVHVYLDGEQGQGFFLGAASYGAPRDDIAARLGAARFRDSGFSLTWDTSRVTPGDHTLNVYALSAATGRWEKFTATVTVVPRPFPDDPLIRMMEPADNGTVGGTNRVVKGWAVDRNAPTGTGVDRVEVWLDAPREAAGTVKLGDATYGGEFGSPADELGDQRFRPSGFLLTWNPAQFRPGNHTLYVYAHSTQMDSWTLRQVPIVIQ